MLFNSYEFIFIFLPVSFFIYFFLIKKRLMVGAKGFLVFSSLFFYSWWNIIYLPIILFSLLFNYVIGNFLNGNFKKNKIQREILLTIGIIANVSLLGYFKYIDFFIENFNLITNSSVVLLHLALPLGISFFTFQQIAYLVDSYHEETAEYDFLNYSLFVTFFPQLIAGPIVHHSEMMPQFTSQWNLVKNYKNISQGIFIFSIGLFKKAVIADSFAIWANRGFDIVPNLNFLEAWATSLSYTFQLYFDFSGYTDMAIGAAFLFNIKLPINFNSPYKATNIQDFWRRWHITLSRFLKDYVYIPLGGNRKSSFKTYINILTTFIIGGLWHGAGWTFIFWGFIHGVALVVHRFWRSLGMKMPKILAWIITFNFINLSWIFFRAKEWKDAIKVLKGMFGGDVELPSILLSKLYFLSNYGIKFGSSMQSLGGNKEISISILVAFIIIMLNNSNKMRYDFTPSIIKTVVISVAFVYSVIAFLTVKSEFLYFNF